MLISTPVMVKMLSFRSGMDTEIDYEKLFVPTFAHSIYLFATALVSVFTH